MKKFTALLVVAAASMYFTGCGENGTNVTNGFADQKGSSSSTEKKGNADEEENGDYDETVEFLDDLPNCTARKDGKVYFVEEDEVAYTCKYDEDLKEGEWVKKEKKTSKPVADETVEFFDDLPNCTSRKDGDIYYIEEDEVYVKCDAEKGDWVPVKTEDKDKPSSSNSSSLPDKPSSSNSSTPTPTSAESYASPVIPEQVSTVADLPTCTNNLDDTIIYVTSKADYYYCALSEWHSLNAEIEDPPTSSASSSTNDYVCGDMWCGPKGEEQVITGLDAGAGESGWWWEYDDNAVSDEGRGNSQFGWYPGKGNEFSESSFLPIIEYNGGIAGTAYLDPGTRTSAYLGVGFNVAGGTTVSGDKVGVDATSWGGICIVYASTGPLTVLLGLTDSEEAYYEYDLPVKHLTASTSQKVVNIPWSAFEQDGWAGGYPISGTEAASQLGAIKFQFNSGESDYITFNIQSIGTYGSCK